jgi:hypothetical protein
MANASGDIASQGAVIAALLLVMAMTLFCLLIARELHRLIGLTAQKVIQRVFGVLLAGLAMQSILTGLRPAIFSLERDPFKRIRICRLGPLYFLLAARSDGKPAFTFPDRALELHERLLWLTGIRAWKNSPN